MEKAHLHLPNSYDRKYKMGKAYFKVWLPSKSEPSKHKFFFQTFPQSPKLQIYLKDVFLLFQQSYKIQAEIVL